MGKGLAIAIVAVFAGFVGYKIIQKKNPELIKKINKPISNVKEKLCKMVDEAKSSFDEGYARG